MIRSAMIRARTEPRLKNEVERIFHALGLSSSEAINIFFYQVKLNQGLPFSVRMPNRTTRKAILEAAGNRGLKSAKNKEDFYKQLGI